MLEFDSKIMGFFFFFHSGSIDGNNQLVIKGRFQQKQIENVLRRYISKFVISLCHCEVFPLRCSVLGKAFCW
jgi:translation initiation factor 2 beta subunit (eIF-2beta)/eIF-5